MQLNRGTQARPSVSGSTVSTHIGSLMYVTRREHP